MRHGSAGCKCQANSTYPSGVCKASAWAVEPANIAPNKQTAAETEGAPPLRPEPREPLEPWLDLLDFRLPLLEVLFELDLEFLRALPPFFSFFLCFFAFLPPLLTRALESPGAGTAGWPSWRKLHLSPRLQTPCLKNLHSGLGVLVGVRPPPGVRDLPLGV